MNEFSSPFWYFLRSRHKFRLPICQFSTSDFRLHAVLETRERRQPPGSRTTQIFTINRAINPNPSTAPSVPGPRSLNPAHYVRTYIYNSVELLTILNFYTLLQRQSSQSSFIFACCNLSVYHQCNNLTILIKNINRTVGITYWFIWLNEMEG